MIPVVKRLSLPALGQIHGIDNIFVNAEMIYRRCQMRGRDKPHVLAGIWAAAPLPVPVRLKMSRVDPYTIAPLPIGSVKSSLCSSFLLWYESILGGHQIAVPLICPWSMKKKVSCIVTPKSKLCWHICHKFIIYLSPYTLPKFGYENLGKLAYDWSKITLFLQQYKAVFKNIQ